MLGIPTGLLLKESRLIKLALIHTLKQNMPSWRVSESWGVLFLTSPTGVETLKGFVRIIMSPSKLQKIYTDHGVLKTLNVFFKFWKLLHKPIV